MQKYPFITGWEKFCSELPSAELVQAWEKSYGSHGTNIGVTCGPASGIIVLDIDTDDKKIMNLCPTSPVVRRGLKGEARVFKYSESIKNFTSDQVEILSLGRQFVIPPSIHPDTKKPYIWLSPDTLENFNKEDLPELDINFLNTLEPFLTYNKRNGVDAVGGRNNSLKQIACAMLYRYEDENKIAQEIYEHDKKTNSPRLFTDQKEGYKTNSEDEALRNAHVFVCGIKKSLIQNGSLNPVNESANYIIDLSSEANVEPAFKNMPYPTPRGFMGDFIKLCELQSDGAQDAIGLGSAIALMGALCSNRFMTRVKGNRNVTPNVYVMNLAHSGHGKSTSEKKIKELLADTRLIGSSNYRSGTSMVKFLPERQERLDVFDEAASWLKAMCSKEAYRSEMVDISSQLYSCADAKYLGIASAGSGENEGMCWHPHVSFLGFTTPVGYKMSINLEMASKGLLPRFLVFNQFNIGTYKGRDKTPDLSVLDARLKKFVNEILAVKKRVAKDFVRDMASTPIGIKYDPRVLQWTKKADDLFLDFDEKCYHEKNKDPGHHRSAFVARFSEHVSKLSLYDAVSVGNLETIEEDNVAMAIRIVESQYHNQLTLLDMLNAENDIHKDLLRVLDIIKCSDNGKFTKRDLVRKTQWLNKRTRDETIASLIESENIELIKVKQKNSDKPIVLVKFVKPLS